MSDENRKPRIGLLGLTLQLYADMRLGNVEKMGAIAEGHAARLAEWADVTVAAPVHNPEQLESAMKAFTEADIDGLVVVMLSYSPSLLSVPVLAGCRWPILVWDTQTALGVDASFTAETLMLNHGMHGVQDFCNVMLRHKRPFELVVGHAEEKRALASVGDWARAAMAVRRLAASTIGRLGEAFEGMGDFAVEPALLTDTFGVSVKQMPMARLAEAVGSVTDDELAAEMDEDRRLFQLDDDLSRDAHRRSAIMSGAWRKVIRQEALVGLTTCFASFDDSDMPTIPFLGICKALADRVAYGGEGDLVSSTAVRLMQFLAPEVNFVEMFMIDFAKNGVLMNHMAEGNFLLAHPAHPVRLLENALPCNRCQSAATLSFTLKPGMVTLFNIAPAADDRFRFIVSKLEVSDEPPVDALSSPHSQMRVSGTDVRDFLSCYSRLGGTHHLAMAYGDCTARLEYAAQMLRVPCLSV